MVSLSNHEVERVETFVSTPSSFDTFRMRATARSSFPSILP